jgi:4-amino-4-deoxy-L-arabinose transferase-like glycosyltransferase
MKPASRVLLLLAGVAALALAVALLPWERGGAPLLTLCVLAVAAWFVILRLEPPARRRPALILFFASLGLRLAVSGLYSFMTGSHGWLDDAIAYDRVGWALAQAWKTGAALRGVNGLEWVAGEPFARVVAAIYWLLGHSPAAVIIFNAVLGAASVYFLYRLGAEMLGAEVGLLSGWMAALYTGFWVYSLMPLKDVLILASTLCFFWTLHRLMAQPPAVGRILGWGVAVAVSGAVVVLMRDYVFIAVALGGLTYMLVRAAQVRATRWLVAASVILLALAVLPLAGRLANYPLPLANFGAGSFLSHIFGAVPTSATLPDLARWGFAHPLSFGAYLGLSIVSTVLAPYAWILPGAIPEAPPFGPYTVGYPGMWLWYLVLPFAVLGVWSSLKRSRGNVAGLLVFAIMLLVLFSLTIPRESRHRDLIMPVFLLLAGEGIIFQWRWRQLAWFAWGPLLLAAVVKLQAWLPLAAALASAGVIALLLWWRSHRPRGARRREAIPGS